MIGPLSQNVHQENLSLKKFMLILAVKTWSIYSPASKVKISLLRAMNSLIASASNGWRQIHSGLK